MKIDGIDADFQQRTYSDVQGATSETHATGTMDASSIAVAHLTIAADAMHAMTFTLS